MTTPESAGADPGVPERVTRPEPGRAGPERAAPLGLSDPPSTAEPAANLSEEVANAVRDGYDVIAKNIRLGRVAAESFRQGDYSIRQVPGDLGDMGLRMLDLARELSKTTFDVCERLLKQLGPSSDAATSASSPVPPPFRPTVTRTSMTPPATAPAQPARLKLTVRFTGDAQASSPTTALDRPSEPTNPDNLSVSPLAPRMGQGAPLTAVSFSVDIAVGGLIATVAIPAGQPPGVYSGLVFAGAQEVPLGVLTVEIAP